MWDYLNTILFSEKPEYITKKDEEVFSESVSESNESECEHPYKCVLTSEYPGNLTYFMSKMKSKCEKYSIKMTPKYKKKTCENDDIPCECSTLKIKNE